MTKCVPPHHQYDRGGWEAEPSHGVYAKEAPARAAFVASPEKVAVSSTGAVYVAELFGYRSERPHDE